MSVTPGVECRSLAIISLTLRPGSWPPSPGLAPWATLISSSRQLLRYSAVTPNRRAVGLEIQQVAQIDGRQAPHLGAVTAVLLVGFGVHRILQHVDEVALEI